MNKTAIKNFAIWARNKLIADISYRAGLMGITTDGIQKALPQSTGTTEFYDIGTAEPYSISGDAVKQRNHLVELIRRKEKETNYKTAYKYVLEEVAYTWFNRLIAVRFMEVNDYLPSHIRVLSSDSGKMEPDLVTTPFDAELVFSRDEEQTIYQLKQENKIDEVFRILFIKQCNALNEILPALFEKTRDYTELLLNLSVIDQDGVVYHLVHDIAEEDFDVDRGGQVEIIGWLYQYYNTEQNELVYDGSFSSQKIPKELLPAATTIYTPDWAVRYMTENSLGRLWLEGHPNEGLGKTWKYYLDEEEQDTEVKKQLAIIYKYYATLNPEDIKVIDPCMGSGHILVYAFDVLMQIYESAGYSKRDAAKSIIRNNLYGLDIDDRAFQMAYFAVMMKARQYNRRILQDRHRCNLYSIKESNGINRNQLKYFGQGMLDEARKKAIEQINTVLDSFRNAKEYGSILKIQKCDWDLLLQFITNVEKIGQLSFDSVGLEETQEELLVILNQGKILSDKYHVVITNPPYLGSSRFDSKLDTYVKNNYSDVKSDLSMVMYMKAMEDFSLPHGMISFITTSAWMFLTSFEKLRTYLYNSKTITSLVDYGSELFEGKVGHNLIVSWVTRNSKVNYKLKGVRLVDYCYSRRDEKEPEFFNTKNHYSVTMEEMDSIPGRPVAYWIDHHIIEAFRNAPKMSDFADVKVGLQTGDNERFLKLWTEVCFDDISFHSQGDELVKWVPHNKAGDYRKWYGNGYYIVNWENNGEQIKACSGSRPQNTSYYFKEGYSWSDVSSGAMSARYWPDGCIFDTCAPTVFPKKNGKYLFGLINSNVGQELMDIMSPTIHYTAGSMLKFPVWESPESIDSIIDENIRISALDWDSFELSWGFKKHPLVRDDSLLKRAFEAWTKECMQRLEIINNNETYLDQFFSRLYGIKNIVVEAGNALSNNPSIRHSDLQREIKSLLSYAVGCMFGRYSVDYNGLAYAGGTWDPSKYLTFLPDTDNVIPISDEEYLEDDIVSRLCIWLKEVYGEFTLEENLDFIAKALSGKGGSSREIIRNYFLNDFFKDHCQTYSVTGSGKRPIYWLFDSGKQNGFKALVYLHRYNADTIGNLRIDYLHRMQRIYESEISRMQDMIDHSTSAREVAQATKRREKLQKQLKECRDYDEKLAHLALSRIELDLDDGVKINYRKVQTANDGRYYEVLADAKNIMANDKLWKQYKEGKW